MKSLNLRKSVQSLYHYLHHEEPVLSELTVKVEQNWAEGKTPSLIEAFLGGSVSISQVIRPASSEVFPRNLDSVLRRDDVLLMRADQAAQSRVEAFIGRSLDSRVCRR